MRKAVVFILSLVGGLLVFWLVTEKVGWADIVKPLFLLQPWQILSIIAVSLLMVWVNILCWSYVVTQLGHKISGRRLWDVWLAGFALNYLTPAALIGGEGIMVAGLKQKIPKLSVAESFISTIILRLLNLAVTIFTIVLGLAIFLGRVSSLSEDIANIFILVIVVLSSAIWFFYHHSSRGQSMIAWLLMLLEKLFKIDKESALEIERQILRFFHKNNKALWRALGLTTLAILVNMFRLFLIILFLGKLPSLAQLLIVLAFMHLAYIVALPATLGSLELAESFAFDLLGLGGHLGSAFSIVLRAAELFLTLLGLLFFGKMWLAFNRKLLKN